jgi:hypothetical protein
MYQSGIAASPFGNPSYHDGCRGGATESEGVRFGFSSAPGIRRRKNRSITAAASTGHDPAVSDFADSRPPLSA